MAALSAEARETARKGLALALQRLSAVGQNAVAEALGVSEATVSRLKNDALEQVVLALAVSGIKLVPGEVRCYLPTTIEPFLALAKQRMAQLESVDQLRWDE